MYYLQALLNSINLNYLPLPAGLDIDIELSVTSHIIRSRSLATGTTTAEAFECAVPTAAAPAIDYCCTANMARGYLNQMSYQLTTISVTSDTIRGEKCSHIDWPSVGKSRFATRFLEEATSNRMIGVCVYTSRE